MCLFNRMEKVCVDVERHAASRGQILCGPFEKMKKGNASAGGDIYVHLRARMDLMGGCSSRWVAAMVRTRPVL